MDRQYPFGNGLKKLLILLNTYLSLEVSEIFPGNTSLISLYALLTTSFNSILKGVLMEYKENLLVLK